MGLTWFAKMISAFNVVTAGSTGAIDAVITHRTGTYPELASVANEAAISEIAVMSDHNAIVVYDGAGGYQLNTGGLSLFEGGFGFSTMSGAARSVAYGEALTFASGISLLTNPGVGGTQLPEVIASNNPLYPTGDATFANGMVNIPNFLANHTDYTANQLQFTLKLEFFMKAPASIADGESLVFKCIFIDADTGEWVSPSYGTETHVTITAGAITAGQLITDESHVVFIPVNSGNYGIAGRSFSTMLIRGHHTQSGTTTQLIGTQYTGSDHLKIKMSTL